MTYYFVSDLHVDFYAPMTRNVAELRKHFEVFFERNFLPADACCIAGDIANNYFTYVEFFLAEAEKIPNIHLLENRIVGGVAGCMGMCDFKYKHIPAATETTNKILWATRWFDGIHWKYMQNNTGKLWRHYDRAFRTLSAKRPKIMMSHFLPLEFDMPKRYKQDPCSNFFYFHGAKYLEKMDDGSIWQAGHTHIAIRREYTDPLGKKHLLLCNPVGYPEENPYVEYGLKREDFLVEVV